MEIVLKYDREHCSRLRVQKHKGIIWRNVSCGGICIKHQYVLLVETPCFMEQRKWWQNLEAKHRESDARSTPCTRD